MSHPASRPLSVLSTFLLLILVACAPDPPTITAIEPVTGPSGGGTEAIVSGTGFQVGTRVLVGDREAEVVSLGADGASVTVRVPGGAPGPQPVTARIEDGEAGDSTATFTYEALRVVETRPADGSELASSEAPAAVEIVLSQEIPADGVTLAVDGVEGETAYDAASRTLTFQPAEPFAPGATYAVKLTGVRDAAGNALAAEEMAFTVAAAPTRGAAGSRSTGSAPRASGGARAGGETYDDGQLVTGWFGAADLPWRDGGRRLDYLWVRDGFRIDGRTFHFRPWEEPVFLGEDADDHDEEDMRLAKQITATVHEVFAEILGEEWRGKAHTSTRGGDVVVRGRIVSCGTGNRTTKMLVGFGAGSGHITFDLKFNDASTGELLAAIHHRTLSSSAWTTTDSRLTQWIERLGRAVAKDGFVELYKDGDEVDD